MIENKVSKNKVILMYGKFSEKIDGTPIIDIPLCNPSNEGNWMGWTKKELEKKNYEAYTPQVTKVWEAPYNEWKKVIDEIGVDENTTLVGLSAGGAAVTRYIIEEKKQIKKLILIAPARYSEGGVDLSSTSHEFYDFEIGDSVKKQIKNGVTIFYDTADSIVKSVHVQMYKEQLNAKVVLVEGYGHFSFLIPTFPLLLKELLASHDE
ncbi:MAG: alpha/beta hydrolase [Patescibacteria group bacterium]